MRTSPDSRRVVVTGIGCATVLGSQRRGHVAAPPRGRERRSRGSRGSTRPRSRRGSPRRSSVSNPPNSWIPRRRGGRTDRSSSPRARRRTVSRGSPSPRFDGNRVGVVIGSGIGGIATLEKQHSMLISRGPDKISPFFIPMMIIGHGGGAALDHLRFQGPELRRRVGVRVGGERDRRLFPSHQSGSRRRDAHRRHRGERHPALARRVLLAEGAFDEERRAGEGVPTVRREARRFRARGGRGNRLSRGARTREETRVPDSRRARRHRADGRRVPRDLAALPTGRGRCARCARRSIWRGCSPSEVDYINAHGTSTELNDASETAAIKEVFGDHARRLKVSSTKSMVGHLLGAAAAVEFIACVLVHPRQQGPPDDQPGVSRSARAISTTCRTKPWITRSNVALSNSFGFGGHNCSLVRETLRRRRASVRLHDDPSISISCERFKTTLFGAREGRVDESDSPRARVASRLQVQRPLAPRGSAEAPLLLLDRIAPIRAAAPRTNGWSSSETRFLSLVVNEYLYGRLHDQKRGRAHQDEVGDREQVDSRRTSRSSTGSAAFILMSEHAQKAGVDETDSVLADTFEAIFGAVFLDGGFEPARGCIRTAPPRRREGNLLHRGEHQLQEPPPGVHTGSPQGAPRGTACRRRRVPSTRRSSPSK